MSEVILEGDFVVTPVLIEGDIVIGEKGQDGQPGLPGQDGSDANVTNENVNLAIAEDPSATLAALGIPTNNIVTESDSFSLSQATHGKRFIRLTKTSGTTTITLPSSGIDTGVEFVLSREGDGDVAFSGGTVLGDKLDDIEPGDVFALKAMGGGTYQFV
jgi:hypothetical protein